MSYKVFFFFSSRRRHTRYWRDWSSDVCSSDLGGGARTSADRAPRAAASRRPRRRGERWRGERWRGGRGGRRRRRDRKRVVEGKRVDLRGRRIIKKKSRVPRSSLLTEQQDTSIP